MNRRHCDGDGCNKVIENGDELCMVKTGQVAVKADIERYDGGWVPTRDYCRHCLGELMFQYSQWLLRKL